jgi:hypothetical protein
MNAAANSEQKERLATIALVASCIGIVLGPLGCIPGVVCGHIARRRIARSGAKGAGLTTAALVIGYVFLAAWTLLLTSFVLTIGVR